MRSSILPLILLPAFATLVSLQFPLSYFWGIILFYLAPGIYVAVRNKKKVLHPILFALLTAIPFTLIVDYIGTASNLWNVPNPIFPLFLNLIPLEDYIWMASAIFTVVMISGVSDMVQVKKFLASKMKTFLMASLIVMATFFILLASYGQNFFNLKTSYLYLILGTVFFALPVILLLFYLKSFSRRHVFATGYFFLLTTLFESVAVHNSWWEFNGAYFLPPLVVSGKALPLEELFFVGIVGACMAILLYRFLLRSRDRVK